MLKLALAVFLITTLFLPLGYADVLGPEVFLWETFGHIFTLLFLFGLTLLTEYLVYVIYLKKAKIFREFRHSVAFKMAFIANAITYPIAYYISFNYLGSNVVASFDHIYASSGVIFVECLVFLVEALVLKLLFDRAKRENLLRVPQLSNIVLLAFISNLATYLLGALFFEMLVVLS